MSVLQAILLGFGVFIGLIALFFAAIGVATWALNKIMRSLGYPTED